MKHSPGFLQGGGEMGELIRTYNWENTPLGKPEDWPLSLRTTVGIILHSAFPMFLFWGKDLLCFYNDAYRPSLGIDGKHPLIGKKGKDGWPDIWDFIGPLIGQVMSTGEAVWFEDQLLPIYRNGRMEDVYWTFSYSPAYGDEGQIEGVFVTCTETTGKVLALQKLEKSQEELLVYFEQSPVAIATISKENLTFRLVNTFYAELVGRKPGEIDNKPLLEALPELEGQGFDQLLNQVLETGVPFIANEVAVNLVRNGVLETIYVNLTYQPQRSPANIINGILVVATDVTQQVLSRRKVENTEAKFRALIEKSPTAISLLVGKELVIEVANDKMITLWGKTEAVMGMTLAEAIPELKGQPFLQLLDDVYTTGKTVEGKAVPADLEVDGVLTTFYFDFSYIAIRDSSGEIYGVMDIATDVTQEVMTRRALEENKNKLDFAIHAAELGTWELKPATYKFTGNNRLKEWFGLEPEEEIDLHLATDVIAEKDREKVNAAIQYALTPASGGAYDVEYTIVNPKTRKEIIVKAKGKALFDGDGKAYNFSGTLQDVTEEFSIRKQLELEAAEQKIAKQKLEESELFSHDIFYNSPVAKLVFTGHEMTVARINEKMLDILGRDQSVVGKPFEEALPELVSTPLLERMRKVFTTGEMFFQPEEKLNLVRFGKAYTGYYSYVYKPVVSTSGEIYGVMVTANEVTEQVTARQIIEGKEKELRDLITAAPIGICVLNGAEAKVEEVNERFVLISGKKQEQFVNATYWEVFPEVAAQFSPILEDVFKTGIKFTTEEAEMVLVRHGIPEKIYATFDYVPVMDINNVVIKVIVLVIEVTHQVETRKQIEEAVILRTKELAESNLNLQRSNAELEQFAYIASHDLQEPIRKISTFTQMLEHSVEPMSDRAKGYINKIYGSTDRMTKLIRDVLAFSRVSQHTDSFSEVDLSKIVKSIELDFELPIGQTQAEIIVKDLPVIEAVPEQMTQLFSNLLSNSLKYTRPGTKPVIHISASKAAKEDVESYGLVRGKAYCHITFSDNGIGFPAEHADRIFRIFQRLHGKDEFEGTGIGLSICRKIVESHHGHIYAAPGVGGGAVFHIILQVTG